MTNVSLGRGAGATITRSYKPPKTTRSFMVYCTRGGAGGGESVASVNVTLFSSHDLRYRWLLGARQSLLRANIFTPTASWSV